MSNFTSEPDRTGLEDEEATMQEAACPSLEPTWLQTAHERHHGCRVVVFADLGGGGEARTPTRMNERLCGNDGAIARLTHSDVWALVVVLNGHPRVGMPGEAGGACGLDVSWGRRCNRGIVGWPLIHLGHHGFIAEGSGCAYGIPKHRNTDDDEREMASKEHSSSSTMAFTGTSFEPELVGHTAWQDIEERRTITKAGKQGRRCCMTHQMDVDDATLEEFGAVCRLVPRLQLSPLQRIRYGIACGEWQVLGSSAFDRGSAHQICGSRLLASYMGEMLIWKEVCRVPPGPQLSTLSGWDILDAITKNVYEPHAHQFSSFVGHLFLETCPWSMTTLGVEPSRVRARRRTWTTY
ncbi:hypothetical protein BDZ97DRAFT_1767101 [Flammula alnicola]|nr:hypothetical protein BDZ97DRAFT_1767101 [Flammula alnicola]